MAIDTPPHNKSFHWTRLDLGRDFAESSIMRASKLNRYAAPAPRFLWQKAQQ
ncbi:MAG: hypothetical protein L3J24_10820 [Xanthomonadales bacterium]|nr:hypothetical protein [Xanthomonadales bacterium]